MLIDLIKKLAWNEYTVEITTYLHCAANGYGFQIGYILKVSKTVNFCYKCRKNLGIDYSDESHPFNNHKHGQELVEIYRGLPKDDDALCEILSNLIKSLNL
jgi:hypothetical protein